MLKQNFEKADGLGNSKNGAASGYQNLGPFGAYIFLIKDLRFRPDVLLTFIFIE